ncbi:hypothetical protein [Dactylosporangium sp. NPDC005555]|uniref:hypothetical protein n=1 Tax=Dactylosporangium sp. NPDC005555 TaxID=3154889 RepID=UPI0033A47C3A
MSYDDDRGSDPSEEITPKDVDEFRERRRRNVPPVTADIRDYINNVADANPTYDDELVCLTVHRSRPHISRDEVYRVMAERRHAHRRQ